MATTTNLVITKLEVGQAQKEATINDAFDTIDAFASFPAARVTHSTTQSIPNNASTALNFNSERYDSNVIHDNSTNNERLTCKTAGLYLITANVGFAANATGIRAILIELNSATFIAAINRLSTGAAATTRVHLSTNYRLAVNDYVRVLAFQDSGGALNTEQTANICPEFMMVRLGV